MLAVFDGRIFLGHLMTNNYPREVAEMALAHTVSDKVEAAYRRGDLLKKRRQLAEAWARYCTSPPVADKGIILPMRGGR
jgi:hypothetical protein